MCFGDFVKGMGTGMAAGMIAGMVITQDKKKLSSKADKVIKAVGQVASGVAKVLDI